MERRIRLLEGGSRTLGLASRRLRPVDERVTEQPPILVFDGRQFAFELVHAPLHLRTGFQATQVPFLGFA